MICDIVKDRFFYSRKQDRQRRKTFLLQKIWKIHYMPTKIDALVWQQI